MDLKPIERFSRKLERLCKRYHIVADVVVQPFLDYTECYFDDGIFKINVTVWNDNIINYRHYHKEVIQEALYRLHAEYAATSGLLHSFDNMEVKR